MIARLLAVIALPVVGVLVIACGDPPTPELEWCRLYPPSASPCLWPESQDGGLVIDDAGGDAP